MYQSVELLVPIFAMLSIFGTIFGMFYFFITTRHKERIMLIENGFDVSSFTNKKTINFKSWLLRISLLTTGIAVGLLIATFIIETYFVKSDRLTNVDDTLYPGFIFLFAGVGLLTSYIIENKFENKLNKNPEIKK